MPKFNVYLLTVAASWIGIEAQNKDEAEVIATSGNDLLRRVLESYEGPYRVVVTEADEDDEELEEDDDDEPLEAMRGDEEQQRSAAEELEDEEDETSTV